MAKPWNKTEPNEPSEDLVGQASKYLELREEWYERLKEEGFVDIEDLAGDLVDEEESRYAKHTLRYRPSRAAALADYFTEAERALANTVFDSPVDRAIWAHHARGSSVREIAELVGQPARTVQNRIERYRRRLGLVRPR